MVQRIKSLLNVRTGTDCACAADDNSVLSVIDVAEDCLTVFAVCLRCKNYFVSRNALCDQLVTDILIHREVSVVRVDCNIREDDLYAFLLSGFIIILPHAVNTGINLSRLIFYEVFGEFAVFTLPIQCCDRMIAHADQSCFAGDLQEVIQMRIDHTSADELRSFSQFTDICTLFR